MLPTFSTDTSNKLQLPSILVLQPTPAPVLPSFPSLSDAVASFRLPSVTEGVSSQPEGDSSSPGRILPLPDSEISLDNILPSSTSNQRRSTRVSNTPSRLVQSWNFKNIEHDQSTVDIFHSTPTPTGPNQITFRGVDQPQRVLYESINKQYLAKLCWAKLLNMCTVTTGTIGAFMANHSQNLSYGNLVEYLNPALFATMANKEYHPTFAEALYGPNSSGFTCAMDTEILTIIELNVFDVVKRMPDMNIISGVWALQRK